nr:translation initiation factor IF-2-like [Symphalangus syndactylus]
MEAPEKQWCCFLPRPHLPERWALGREAAPRRPGAGRGGRGGAGRGSRGALTAAARPCWRAAQAWPPREPAGRREKERPEPSGSLPWDTSCSALGLGRSPHLSGSLPRPPAEVCAGGDIRHPRPAPLRARLGLAAGPGALWVSHVAAPGPPRGPACPEGRPGALFSVVLLRRPQDARASGRPERPTGSRGWGWKLALGVRDGAERGGPARSRPPHFRLPLRPPPPPPAEARAAQPLLQLRDAEGSAHTRAFRAWRPRAESPG